MVEIVGIGEIAVVKDRDATIKTFALASCVAVTVYDPEKRVSGMIHIALPKPHHEEEAREKPGYYATTGIPLLLNRLYYEYGCKKEQLEVRVYGGAVSIKEHDVFKIGPKNVEQVRKILEEHGLEPEQMDVGGRLSRTLEMEAASGQVKVLTNLITI